MPGLEPDELARVERLVQTGDRRAEDLGRTAPGGGTLNHNCVQVVGEGECEPRPHTDSRALCRYAAVLYLNPKVPEGLRHELLPPEPARRARSAATR